MRALIPSMLFLHSLLALAAPHAARAQAGFGAAGGEAEPNRLQQWLVPTPYAGH